MRYTNRDHCTYILTGSRFLAEADTGIYSGYALVVEQLDRLSRLELIDTNNLHQRILNAGLEIYVTQENRVIKNLNDFTTAVLSLFGAYNAHEYSKKLRERVTSAWKNKRKNAKDGQAITANLPAWLTGKAGEQIQVDEQKAEIVREVFRLAAAGSGKRMIARILTERGIPPITGGKKWDATYVGRVLLSRAVLGERVSLLASRNNGNAEVRTSYYPAVVDAELWQAAQAAISARRGKTANGEVTGKFQGRSGKVVNLFKGLISDVTTGESVPMYLQDQGNGRAIRLSTEKLSAEDKPRWILMDYFEQNFLAFLDDLPWQDILGEQESAELREARTAVANLKQATEQGQQQVESIGEALIKNPSSDFLSCRLSEGESKLAELKAELPAAESRLTELEARHAALLDNSVAFKRLAGTTDTAIRMQLQGAIRRKVKSITFNFRGRAIDTPEFPAGEHAEAWIEFVNGAKRILTFGAGHYGAWWLHSEDEEPAGPPDGWQKEVTSSEPPARSAQLVSAVRRAYPSASVESAWTMYWLR